MVEQRHLPRAPITEALVDIQVKLPPNVDVAKLKSMHGLISEKYPKHAELVRSHFTFVPQKKSAETTPVCVCGYKYTSADDKQVIQVRLDGFTFSRLRPYKTWESLRKEAYLLWGIYVKLFSPEIITRVALRYINRLEIPQPLRDFRDYLTAPPEVPQNLPQEISSFLTRIVIPEPSLNATAIITQALATTDQKIVPVILDIDVFKVAQFNTDGKEVWETIDKLRVLKNNIFFESITEKIVELYQ